MNQTVIAPLSFHQQEFTVLEDLVNAMGENWTEGRQLLFSGTLRNHVKKVDSSFANTCAAAEKEFQAKGEEGNSIFLKWLCKYPKIKGLYWKGKNYGGIRGIVSALSVRDETVQKLLLHMLRMQYLNSFLENVGGPAELVDNVRFLEKAYNRSNSRFRKRNALPMLESFLQGNKTFDFAGRQFKTPKELAAYLQTFADTSKGVLSQAIQPLFQDDHNFEPHFEAWIIMHGYQHEMMLWKGRFQDGQGDSEDIIDLLPDEEQEQIVEARQQLESEFAKALDGFDDRFTELLTQYQDQIDNAAVFNALMNDYFPMNKLQSYLLVALYRMDIVRAIRDADELTDLLMARFEKRLVKDLGVKEAFAKWAAAEWCLCYGERVLNKKNMVHPLAG